MRILNEHGEEWINLPPHQFDQTSEIAVFLHNYFPGKTALLVGPTVIPHLTIEIAKKLNVDLILQERASHCVDLFEPTFAKDWDIPFYYLSSNFDFLYNPVPGILFYPYWLTVSRTFPDNSLIFGSEQDINRQYMCSSICRHPKEHRIYNFIKLQNKNYFNKVYWTFYKCDHINVDKITGVTDCEQQQFDKYYAAAPSLTRVGESECIRLTSWDAFTNSYLNLTSETYTNYNFLSEKSYKPFLAGQIPVIYGPRNANKMLSDIGFDMFYDVIDHNKYDNLPTIQERIDVILDSIESIADTNFLNLFSTTTNRRMKNKKHLFSQEVLDLLLTPLFNKLREI